MILSESNFAVLVCPFELENPAPAIEWYSKSAIAQGSNSAKFVAVSGKFTPPPGIKTLNVETGYPAEIARLVTHAHWARLGGSHQQINRDARALFCLDRLIKAHPAIQLIALVPAPDFDDFDLERLSKATSLSRPFHPIKSDETLAIDTSSILFDRTNPNFEATLKLALDLALSGAIYGFMPGLEAVLQQASNAATVIASHLDRESGRK